MNIRRLLFSLSLLSISCMPAVNAQSAPGTSPYFMQFGGTGFDGVVTISANTNPANYVTNAAAFTLNSGISLTCKSGTIINSQRAILINGTVASGQEITGGPAPGTRGGAYNGGYAGGGGGCGGFGGAGAGAAGAAGGDALPITPGITGSVGGYGSPTTNPGNGAGNLRMCSSGTITVSSTGLISYPGAGGASINGAATTGGGGGGSGGVVLLYSQVQVINSGTISIAGGGGGSGTTNANGGGGGAGGFVVMMSPTAPTIGTITTTGGNGGSAAGSGIAGTAGGAGLTISITDTPSYPLLAEFEKRLPIYGKLARLRGGNYIADAHESRSLLAALKAAEEGKDFQTALREIGGEENTATAKKDDTDGAV